MSIFNEDGYEEQPALEASQPAVPEQPQSTKVEIVVNEPVEEAEEEFVVMSEVEIRLEKAQYYQQLMKMQWFEENNNIVNEVVDELKTFVRERMATLMGVGAPSKVGRPRKAKATVAPEKPVLVTAPAVRPIKKKPLVAAKPTQAVSTTKASGQTITIKGEDGVSKVYRQSADNPDAWFDDENQRYTKVTNAVGGFYMRNITGQAAAGTVKPFPTQTADQLSQTSTMHATRTTSSMAGILAKAVAESLK
jgi:hypothetical protein